MPIRFRRFLIAALATIFSLLLVAVIGCARLYVFPDVDPQTQSDVVFVIGPPTATRIAIAESMMNKGLSDNLIISVATNGPFDAAKLPICTEEHAYHVYCLTPDPFTTQGEARALQLMAAEHDWSSATVITFTPHVTRARVLMSRCFSGSLYMVPDTVKLSDARWLHEFFYQSAAFLKVLVDADC
jgi:hypothetical protein